MLERFCVHAANGEVRYCGRSCAGLGRRPSWQGLAPPASLDTAAAHIRREVGQRPIICTFEAALVIFANSSSLGLLAERSRKPAGQAVRSRIARSGVDEMKGRRPGLSTSSASTSAGPAGSSREQKLSEAHEAI